MPFKNKTLRSQSGKSAVFLAIFVVVALLVGIAAQQISNKPVAMPKFSKLILLPKPKQLGAVDFINQDSENFGPQKFKGKWSILFFAFTNCPDICPATMQVLKQVKQDLQKAQVWNAFQVAMVSVDPERDTPARLKQYVPFFDPEFIGLTGDLDYTERFAKNLGILFFKGEILENGGYDVDHGASLILINPNGEYAGVISAPHKREQLSADLLKLGNYALKNQQISATASPNNLSINTSVAGSNAKQAPDTALTITNAWIRPSPPNATAMAGYFTIKNNSLNDIRVTGVNSPLFAMSMIHQTVIEDGVASMEHLDDFTIEAGTTQKLAPLSTHLMLMRPKQNLPIGSQVPIALELSSGATIETSIEVRNEPTIL